jgi:hypothetical protein
MYGYMAGQDAVMTTQGAVAVGTKRRTCLLVAPPIADLSVVRRLLQERGVESIALSDVPPLGVTVLDQLNKALAQSDFVIFVLSPSDTNTSIYFEIGLALGQGKKLMVIAPGDAAAMPADLRELLIVKAQLDNDEAIGFPLDQFLAAPPSNGATAAPTAEIKGQPLGDTADALIQRAEALKNRVAHQSTNVDAHQELEQIVIEALEASHVAPVVASQGQDRQADLAVWVDELDSLGLNPLLIELKGRLDTWEAIDAAVDQAEAYLRSFRAQAILILFVAGPRTDREMPAPSFPNVLPFDLIDLLNRMRTKSFGTVLRAAIYDGMAANKG